MNLPNKLTLSRILSAPLFFIIFSLPEAAGLPMRMLLPFLWILFLLSEVTDALDGYLARRMNLVTDMGKLMDPFADVISRMTYFLCFTMMGWMPFWAFLLVLYRELGITFIRMIMIRRGIALAARIGGKLKAIFYFISGLFGVIALSLVTYQVFPAADKAIILIAKVLFSGAAVAALISFVDYLLVFSKFQKEQSPAAE